MSGECDGRRLHFEEGKLIAFEVQRALETIC